MNVKELENHSDESLVNSAREGNETALELLFQRYRTAINAKANLYYLVGGDKDDLIQEGMIGLFRSIRDYDDTKNASFRTFAELCINRQMLTAVKKAARLKNGPLNSSLSLHGFAGEGDEDAGVFEDIIAASSTSEPEEIVLYNDLLERLKKGSMKHFSKFEMVVWNEYLNGMTYTEIAAALGKSPKAIDNATQRIKKKVEKILNMS